MRRVNSTVVVVAGEQAADVIAGLDGLGNVRAIHRPPEETMAAVARATSTYVVHDADPLAEVSGAWADFFDGTGVTGALEVAIEQALAGLRADRLMLPDYYVVLNPGDLPGTRRHWWLGVLAGAAPSRVVPAGASVPDVAHVLGTLSTGRWWPADIEGWLRGLPKVVPDRAGLPV